MRRRYLSISLTLAILATAGVLRAQDTQPNLADRAPRFMIASATKPSMHVPLDVTRTPVLHQRIAVDLEGATLAEALATIARKAGLKLIYSNTAVPADRRVQLKAENITVAAALTEVLLDANVDVVLGRDNRAALVKRIVAPFSEVQKVGVIVGTVTDAANARPLASAQVWVEGTRLNTLTDAAGKFRIASVPAGMHKVSVSLIGYKRSTHDVTVAENGTVTADFALAISPTTLSEIVVTATGDKRRMELGHVVGRINADSLVKEAPISSLSELLTARVPGLQVFQTQGTVGGQVKLQIRGPNSFNGARGDASNEPIFVIDGIRYTTETRGNIQGGPYPGMVEPTSPLNDLNPNDIETIEVIKGPSASTLYGTDAANGVVVITTKRGKAGPARWSAYANRSSANIPTERIDDILWGWGTVNGIPNNPELSCTLARKGNGQCTQQDSITLLRSALKDPRFSIFGSKPSYGYGLNVSGGTNELRYYFSGDFTDQTGAIRMPQPYIDEIKARTGKSELPKAWREPNSLTNMNLRSNVNALLGKVDLRLNSGYVRNSTNPLTFEPNIYRGAPNNTPRRAETDPYSPGGNPASSARMSTDDVDRFITGLSGEIKPMPWLMTRALVGIDVMTSDKHAVAMRGDNPRNSTFNLGIAEDTRTKQQSTTLELTSAATARVGPVTARTAVGAQYTRTLFKVVSAQQVGLAPGQEAIGSFAEFAQFDYRENKVLGAYVEESLSLNERLFLTGAVRADGAATFGADFKTAYYPKASASWVVTSEPFFPRVPKLDELRLRASLGASGVQVNANYARPGFFLHTETVDGVSTPVYYAAGLGNPKLRPERSREIEWGFDATAFDGRLNAEITGYTRETTDQIVFVPLPSGLDYIAENLGLTSQRGFEARINARLVDLRQVSLDLTLNHSNFTTKLEDVGRAYDRGGDGVRGGWRVGYPIGARFYQPIKSFTDADGDGVVEYNEIVFDTLSYAGESTPPSTQTLTGVLGFLDRRVRVSALFERKSGFTQLDPYRCPRNICREMVDWSTPLDVQAGLVIWGGGSAPQDATHIRWQELSVAADIPARVNRLLHLNSSSVAFSARNLALWSSFTGPDPSVSNPGMNRDEQRWSWYNSEPFGIPLSRSYSVRVNVGF